MQSPFNEGTRFDQILQILADCEWHCGKHELPGTQPAKAIQVIRQNGFEIENKTMYCQTCQYKTVHRRLISTEPSRESFLRISIPSKLRKRILAYYENTEAITMRKMEPNQLEIDHRFPQVRWAEDEHFDPDMSVEEIYQRFQLLTRPNNLWKSRYCENCKATGKRGIFIGIIYFAEGDSMWDSSISEHDERGCYGCFWYNPEVWRASLNATLQSVIITSKSGD